MKAKNASEIAQKWARLAPGRASEYSDGIARTSADEYAAAAAAAEPIYAQGVTQAIAEGRYAAGVTAKKARWKTRASEVGASRYTTGVASAADEYARGYAPYADVIQSTALPPRGPKGDPRNIERVRIMAEALRARKAAMQR